MTDTTTRLADTLDRAEIREVLAQYPSAIDARDWDRLRAAFTDDASVRYGEGMPSVTGADEIVEHIRSETAHLLWQHHHTSVYGIELEVDGDPDAARAQVYLLSHQMVASDTGHALMMASRYWNELRRVDGDWRISRVELEVVMSHYLGVVEPPAIAVSELLDSEVRVPGIGVAR